MNRLRSFALCVLMGTATAVIYGIVHDMITAHVCVEYFTIFHPRVIESKNPIILALVWGVIATWWVGLPLGILMGIGAILGSRPPLELKRMVRILGIFAMTLLVVSTCTGIWSYGEAGPCSSARLVARGLPPEKISRFWYNVGSHNASYGFGVLGGLMLPIIAWGQRRVVG